jgi:hypothetical protein
MHVPALQATDAAFAQGTMGFAAYSTPARFTYFDFRSTARNGSEAWYSYPNLEGASPITVSPETWKVSDDVDIQGGDFLYWWYEHLPKRSGLHAVTDLGGTTVRGRLNTWLPLVFDINEFDGTAVYDAAFPPSDVLPPAPVGGLQATPVSSHVVELRWQEPSDDVGVTRYDVYRGTTHLAQVKSPKFTDSGLAPNTPYTYTVKARDGSGNRSSATVTVATETSADYLSDLDWVSATNGFQSIGFDKANGGVRDLLLGGVRYAKGLGVHATSEIEYAIGGRGYQRLLATVGAQDGEWGCSVRFEAWVDGVKHFDSGPMFGTTGPTTQIAAIDLDVTGASRLVLKVLSLDAGLSGDHGVWGGVRLTK